MKVDSTKKAGLSIDYSQSTTGVTLDAISEEQLAKYSKKTIDNACRLKAKYGSKYSDEYYLDYSSRNTYINMVENLGEPQRARASMSAIQDPNWQGYSYEEIIQMENNGVKIPQEVLLWAHSQQESDIVSYEVIESEALNDDNSSTGEVSNNSSDINTLLKNAQIYTVKSTSAQKTAEEDAQKYSELSTQAKRIQSENKNTYKDELDKISKLTKEWKQLDTKNKNGTLNISEKVKYSELSKTINSESTTSSKKEIAFNERELDELLSSMSGLSEKTTENTKTANETIQASEALSNKIKTYNTSQQTHNSNGVLDEGSLENPITGTNAFSIESVSMEAGKNLEEQTNNTEATLTEASNLEVKEFAKEYSRSAQEAVKSTNNSTKTNNETDTTQSSEDGNNTAEPEEEKTKTYKVKVKASEKAALKATATTILSMADLLMNQANVSETKDSLEESQKKTTKEAKNVQKEEKKTVKEHKSNEKKVETKEKELENVKKQKEESVKSSSEQVVQDSEPENDTTTPDNTEDKIPPQPPVIDEGDAEEETIANEILTITKADDKLKGVANLQNTKLKQSVSADSKIAKTLDKQNKGLDKRNNNAKEVATKTIVTGTITTVDGILNITKGTPMLASVNPATVAEGAKIVKDGTLETIAGGAAIATGGIAAGVSASVADNIRDFNDITKDAKITNKTQLKQVKETNQNLKNIGAIEVSENVQETSAGSTVQPEQPEKSSTAKVVKTPEKQKPVVENIEQPENTTTTQESETPNDNPQPTEQAEQTQPARPTAQTSQSKAVTASQVEEKPLSDEEKISIIKENYSDDEIEARISDDEENDDSNIIAAASINASANIVKTTNTDDKLARKLSRFNNDSIIESRKKMKKVQAVSASSGKKA